MNWKYFTLKEFTRSRTADKLGFFNTPLESDIQNLDLLVSNILDPLRKAWGKPIIVTSGFRVPRLNEAVGGVKNSDHLYGRAADIYNNVCCNRLVGAMLNSRGYFAVDATVVYQGT